MLIIKELKNYAMDGCNVVIIAYRVCQLCASYSAMINFAMFNFVKYIYIHPKSITMK